MKLGVGSTLAAGREGREGGRGGEKKVRLSL